MNINPHKYFRDHNFSESLVLRVVHDNDQGQIEFVLAYMDYDKYLDRFLGNTPPNAQGDPDAPWDFRRLLFCQVTQIRRVDVFYKSGVQGFDPASLNFSGATTPLTPTIEFVHMSKNRERSKAEINIGSLGTYHFEFDQMLIDRRLVKIVSDPPNSPSHIDYYTGQNVDFYDPFPASYAKSEC